MCNCCSCKNYKKKPKRKSKTRSMPIQGVIEPPFKVIEIRPAAPIPEPPILLSPPVSPVKMKDGNLPLAMKIFLAGALVVAGILTYRHQDALIQIVHAKAEPYVEYIDPKYVRVKQDEWAEPKETEERLDLERRVTIPLSWTKRNYVELP